MGVVTLEPPRLVVAVLIDSHLILHIPVLLDGRALGGVPDRRTVSRYGSRRQIAGINAICIVGVLFPERTHGSLRTFPCGLSKVPKPVGHLDDIETDVQGECGPLLNRRVRCQIVKFFEGIELVWPRARS